MCYKSRGPTVISHWSQNESCALCRSYPGQLRSSRGQAIWKSVAKNLDFFWLLIEDGVLRTQLGLQVLTSELKTCVQPAYICYYRVLMEASFFRCIVSSVVCNLSRYFNRDRVPSTIFSCRQIQIRQNISLDHLKIFMHQKVNVIAGCVTC